MDGGRNPKGLASGVLELGNDLCGQVESGICPNCHTLSAFSIRCWQDGSLKREQAKSDNDLISRCSGLCGSRTTTAF